MDQPMERPMDKPMDRRVDVAIAFACVVFGAVMVYKAQQLRDNEAFRDPLGIGGLPTLLGAFIALGGVIIIVRYAVSWRRQSDHAVDVDGRADEPGHHASAARAFGLWAVLVAYSVLLPIVGFLIATPAALFACLWIAHFRRPLPLGLISIGLPLALYGMFDKFLGMNLPHGPLSGIV